ncbi:lachesin-like isoform X1 [Vespula maculifrons]|uniref:Lachesin-like isoform X1 n=1 Tax=Vespula maculifrons TaxID=7453 RepID=A0ABD2BBR7_VESMC
MGTFLVSWVRRRGEDFHLLTIGLDTYASDSRFSLEFEGPNDWRLQLKSATERDAGLYECQVSVHPPLIRTVHLSVSGKVICNVLDSYLSRRRNRIVKRYNRVGNRKCRASLSMTISHRHMLFGLFLSNPGRPGHGV